MRVSVLALGVVLTLSGPAVGWAAADAPPAAPYVNATYGVEVTPGPAVTLCPDRTAATNHGLTLRPGGATCEAPPAGVSAMLFAAYNALDHRNLAAFARSVCGGSGGRRSHLRIGGLPTRSCVPAAGRSSPVREYLALRRTGHGTSEEITYDVTVRGVDPGRRFSRTVMAHTRLIKLPSPHRPAVRP